MDTPVGNGAPADDPSSGKGRLDSWKEIASYLGRSERTVRRWEEKEDLPVHRLEHDRRASVYAFRHELDAWRASRTQLVRPEPKTEEALETAARPKRAVQWAAAGAILCVMIASAMLLANRGPSAPPYSVAVLPFDNLSGNAQDEWFADGMTEMLLTELARYPSLRVTSRTSSTAYKKAGKPVKQIGAELQVRAILEGSATRIGNRVRITAQLIDTATDRHLWSSEYDREVVDALRLHREIAGAIAREVGLTLNPAQSREPRGMQPEALEAYLRALYLLKRRDLDSAVRMARESIAADANFAEPYDVLGEALLLKAETRRASYAEVVPEGRAALQNSLRLSPDRGKPMMLLAWSLFAVDHDWSAGPQLLRASQLAPETAYIYGYYLAANRRFDEAIAAARISLARDPANPSMHADMGHLYYFARRFPEAIASFRKALELNTADPQAHYYLPMAYLFGGQPDRAFEEWLWITRPSGRMAGKEPLFRDAYRSGGWPAVWRVFLDQKPAEPGMRLRAALQRNDIDEAFRDLDYVERTNDPWLIQLQDPIYDPIRNHPRFRSLLHRIGYPEAGH